MLMEFNVDIFILYFEILKVFNFYVRELEFFVCDLFYLVL